MAHRERPLSPHLQVYSLKFHMVLSGLHRITGVVLGGGTMLLVWWTMALASGPESYGIFQRIILYPLGRLVLFGFSFSLIYHALNGIRHLVWDTGRGFAIPEVIRSGVAVVLLSALLTVAAWAFGYMQAGLL